MPVPAALGAGFVAPEVGADVPKAREIAQLRRVSARLARVGGARPPLEIVRPNDPEAHAASLRPARLGAVRKPRVVTVAHVADLPPPAPPEERTAGQLVAEALRLYGRRFWAALALGVPPTALAALFIALADSELRRGLRLLVVAVAGSI